MTTTATETPEQVNGDNGNLEADELLPHTVWDEYVGQFVCIQLKRPYFVITAPGRPAMQETTDGVVHINVTVVAGIFGLKKDQVGNVRATLTMRDPDQNKKTPVRAEFDPALFDVITVTPIEQPQPKSNIIMPS